jgi:hypothetical protein
MHEWMPSRSATGRRAHPVPIEDRVQVSARMLRVLCCGAERVCCASVSSRRRARLHDPADSSGVRPPSSRSSSWTTTAVCWPLARQRVPCRVPVTERQTTCWCVAPSTLRRPIVWVRRIDVDHESSAAQAMYRSIGTRADTSQARSLSHTTVCQKDPYYRPRSRLKLDRSTTRGCR